MMPYLAFLLMSSLFSMIIVSGTGKMQIHPRTHSHVLHFFGGLEVSADTDEPEELVGREPAGVEKELAAAPVGIALVGKLADNRLAETEKMPAPLPLEPFDDLSQIRSRPFLPRLAGLSESRHLLAGRHRNSCRKPFSYPCRLQAERRSLGR